MKYLFPVIDNNILEYDLESLRFSDAGAVDNPLVSHDCYGNHSDRGKLHSPYGDLCQG